MSTQTKMNASDRQERKMLKAAYPNIELFSFPELGATVGVERTGATRARFAVALMGGDETKFRRKVGELVTLRRFDMEQTMPTEIGESSEAFAQAIAVTITGW